MGFGGQSELPSSPGLCLYARAVLIDYPPTPIP
jgi:hypothetical protein